MAAPTLGEHGLRNLAGKSVVDLHEKRKAPVGIRGSWSKDEQNHQASYVGKKESSCSRRTTRQKNPAEGGETWILIQTRTSTKNESSEVDEKENRRAKGHRGLYVDTHLVTEWGIVGTHTSKEYRGPNRPNRPQTCRMNALKWWDLHSQQHFGLRNTPLQASSGRRKHRETMREGGGKGGFPKREPGGLPYRNTTRCRDRRRERAGVSPLPVDVR